MSCKRRPNEVRVFVGVSWILDRHESLRDFIVYEYTQINDTTRSEESWYESNTSIDWVLLKVD